MKRFANASTEELIALRDEASQAYYAGEVLILEDSEFDLLLDELKSRGVDEVPSHGYEPAKELPKVIHEYPMQSLQKVKGIEEVEKWAKKMPSDSKFLVQPKYDGFAINITYNQQGKFIQAATRGNHKVGENITHSVQAMIDNQVIPATINPNGYEGLTHVRGEAYITGTDFKKLQEEKADLYQSSRNSAPGIMRRSDTSLVKYISFVAYDTNNYDEDEVDAVEEFGFTTPRSHYYKVAKNIRELHDYVMDLETYRFENFDFNTDGAVIKLFADRSARETIGLASLHPRWAVAYKYRDSPKVTTIRSVEWNHNRTGKLTPVAIFDPVNLDEDSVTTKATLANYRNFMEKDFRPGDKIKIVRSGGVIPYIIGLDADSTRPNTESFRAPAYYPTPEYPTKLSKTGADMMVNENAPAPVAQMVEHSLSSLEVKGIGSSIIDELLTNEKVENFLDMLNLTVEDIDSMRGKTGQNTKSAQNIVNALQSVFTQPLWKWVAAIGVAGVGKTKAPVLELKYGSLEEIANARFRDLIKLEKFNGGVHARNIVEAKDVFAEWARRLKTEHNFTPELESHKSSGENRSSSLYSGKTVVVTGSFPSMGRKEVEQWLKNHGATIGSSVSSKTNLVIYGEKAGSKLEKARKLGIESISAQDFEENANN